MFAFNRYSFIDKFIILFTLIICVIVGHVNGGGFVEIYRWKQITYDILESSPDNISFMDEATLAKQLQEESSAKSTGYIAYNNIPMGVTHYKGKLFITMPRRRPGIPATLNYIYTNAGLRGSSPSLKAFPSYKINELHPLRLPDPLRIISVYRTRLDVCNRLWFIDTGLLEYPNNFTQIQRPSIWAINLKTNERVVRFEIPESIVNRGNGLASITIDVEKNNCNQVFAYIPDLVANRLYVYSMEENKIWSFHHNYFSFDPLNGDFDISGIRFQWDDGIFSITLGNKNRDGYRQAFFHAMASVSEFAVSTRVLRNETASTRSYQGNDFMYLGSRGDAAQSAMHDFDSATGIIFFSQVGRNGVSCWNTNKPLIKQNHVLLASNDQSMIYPSDLTIDQEGNVWIMTNSMPLFIYASLNPNEYNFRIWRQTISDAVRGTECEINNRFEAERPHNNNMIMNHKY